LVQQCHEIGIKNAIVAYNDTGWAHPSWPERMIKVKDFAKRCGYSYQVIKSKGFFQMVKDEKIFPMAASKMTFCSQELKTKPSKEWLNKVDPGKKAICIVGVRREESQNRANHPEWLYMTKLYEGRKRWFPLVDVEKLERDHLITRAGFNVLHHPSLECFPCVNSNRSDFRRLAKFSKIIDRIELLETIMGFTLKGKPKTMFRPYRHMGATGIREVVKWGLSDRGKYKRKTTIAKED